MFVKWLVIETEALDFSWPQIYLGRSLSELCFCEEWKIG